MGLFEHFPYSNIHEMNLDFILSEIKRISDEMVEFEEGWAAQKEEFSTYRAKMEAIEADWQALEVSITTTWSEIQANIAADTAAEVASAVSTFQAQYDSFLETYQREFGIAQTLGSSTTDAVSQAVITANFDRVHSALDFDLGTLVDGYYVNYTNGKSPTMSGYSRTNQVDIPKGVKYLEVVTDCLATTSQIGIAFYSDWIYVGGSPVTTTNPHSVTTTVVPVPDGARSFRACVLTAAADKLIVRPASSLDVPITTAEDDIYKLRQAAFDVIRKNYTLEGETVLALGDSIIKGYNDQAVIVENNFFKLFCDEAGANGVNNAAGGASYTKETNNIIAQIDASNFDAVDAVIIAAGTNDYNSAALKADFTEAVEDTFDELDAANVNDVPVFIITPVNRTKPADSLGAVPLEWYRSALTEQALLRGYNVVDGSSLGFSPFAGDYQLVTMPDGLHPSATGHAIYARCLAAKLL